MTTAPGTRPARPRRLRPRRWTGGIALVAAAALALTGCASSGGADEAAEPVAVEIPDTAIGERTQWVVDLLNEEEDTTEPVWEAALHPNFLEEVPASEFVDLINQQVRPARPFTPTSYEAGDSQSVTRLEGAQADAFDMQLSIDGDGLIVGMFFAAPEDDDWEAAGSLAEVEKRLGEFPGEVHAYVARAGSQDPLIDIDSQETAPIASAFKLYVLLAVAQAVDEGELSWDDELTVTDDVKSLPSGELQNAEEGTSVTVRDAAAGMISISDNTATDMLIDRVGRDAVEEAVAASGHHDPAAMRPFPTTQQMFTLGWGASEWRDRWEGASEDERKDVLDEMAAEPFEVGAGDVGTEPRWSDGADWFASARDLAAAHTALHELDDAEVRDILSANPGIAPAPGDGEDSAADSPYIAFKGGSSVGVLTGSWLVEGEDGEVFTIVLQHAAADEDDALELSGKTSDFANLARDAMGLLADG